LPWPAQRLCQAPPVRWQCFRDDPDKEAQSKEKKRTATGASRGAGDGPGATLLCRACGAAITNRNASIQVEGKHEHTFFNPAGVLFEIGCFSLAPGCVVAGVPTSEFAWFRNYLWQYASCSGCGVHLGWYFASAPGSAFYGLIVNRLVENDEEPDQA
jgi:hypothetical protein